MGHCVMNSGPSNQGLRGWSTPCQWRVIPVNLVVDVNDDNVALARVDGRPGELAVHGEDGLPLAEPGDLRLYLQHITRKALVVDQQNQFRERKASCKYVVKKEEEILNRSTYKEIVVISSSGLGGINCNSKG
jgi:hypothetical protein